MKTLSLVGAIAMVAALMSGTIAQQQQELAPRIEAPADPDDGCVSFEIAKVHVHAGYSNLRLVAPDMAAEAILIYEWLANDDAPDNVDLVALMDRNDGGGAIVFGHDGKVCQLLKIDQDDWYLVVKALEGVGI